MNRKMWAVVILGLCIPSVMAQNSEPAESSSTAAATAVPATGAVTTRAAKKAEVAMAPFSQFALSGGLGINGINLQAATNLNRHANLRVTGNAISYTVTSISSNGFTADGGLSFGTMGASVDYFPFPRHGLRLSPGMWLYNHNELTAHATVTAGQSFTLNDVDYYSSANDPVRAAASLKLGAHNAAFTLTTGWGNMIPRRGGHWSFPVEIGAAFVGTPKVDMALAGTACDAQGKNCVNVATDPTVQSNLQAQIGKYKHDLDPLKTWPIFSFGLSYSFTGGKHAK